jgi:hypothetical protein
MSSACCWTEVSGHLHPPDVLPLVKVIQVPIEQEDGWVLEPEWMLWRKKNLLPLLGIKPWFLIHVIHSLVQFNTKICEVNNKIISVNNVVGHCLARKKCKNMSVMKITLLWYYTVSVGNYIMTFQGSIMHSSAGFSRPLKMKALCSLTVLVTVLQLM